MGFNPGGGGTNAISTATDVVLNNPATGQVLTYDATAGKWKNLAAKSGVALNVMDYGAKGDGTTDDSTAFQNAINAVTAQGGGTVFFPPTLAGYVFATGMVVTSMNLTSKLAISAYGARLTYSGSGDALLINTNIGASDVQNGERTVHVGGLHIVGSSAATSGIRNYGGSRCSFKDTTLDGFTSLTSGNAALVFDARNDFWVEECHVEGLEIKNTGNGICFISENDVNSVPASCENNVFTTVSIWITQVGGKGVYGLGKGATTQVLLSRSVFISTVVHPYNVTGVTAFDFGACLCDGIVLVSPAVDIVGTVTGLVVFNYTGTSVLVVLGAKADAIGSVTTFYGGGGKYLVLGGNAPSSFPFSVDASANLTASTLTLQYDLYDANGKGWLHQAATVGAVNDVAVGNSTTGTAPYITPNGTDTNIGLSLYGKGTGVVSVNGSVPQPTPATNWTQFAVPGVTTSISATYTANTLGCGQIQVPVATYLTGISVFNGATINGNVLVGLFTAAGTLVASSASTVQTGSYAMQAVPFTTGYTAAAGTYYIGVVPSSASATFALTCCYGLSGAVAPGSFTVPASITPPATVGAYIIATSTY